MRPVSGRISFSYFFQPFTGFMLIDSLISGQKGAFQSAVSHLILPTIVLGTIPLALSSFALGLAIALAVALMRLSRIKVVAGLARAYVSLIRGTPLLVQLFVIFYGLPSIGATIDPWPSAIIAFSLNVGGYAAEVIRAAILSVPKGQWEAAHTVGLSHTRSLTRIILPQAARVSVPPLSNTFISLVKDTSLASLILVTELFRQADFIRVAVDNVMEALRDGAIFAVAVIFLFLWNLRATAISGPSLRTSSKKPLSALVTSMTASISSRSSSEKSRMYMSRWLKS